ncbi:MAG: hypothetical protein K8T20_01295, partial [Planctomycetes bacterium]|nr:hypothetical protein [Planctomycetota bacterium]
RRPSPGSSVESVMTGGLGTYRELVIENSGAKGPAPRTAPTILQTETNIDATGESEIVFRRLRPGGTEQRDRAPKPDPFVPPDLSASDGLLVALAGSPEGTYAFASLQERALFIRWKEYRVKGEEEVEVPAGKFKARRIEVGSKAVYWVAEGKIVKADLGDFVRKLAPEADVQKYFKN